VFSENFHKIATYFTETFSANYISLTILVTTAVSITYFLVISYIIIKMDKRYFVRKKISGDDAIDKPLLRSWNSSVAYMVKLAKITIGIVLLICGLAMLVLPGQGLITILISLSLLPFPGKNKIEQKLLSRKSVRSSLNWVRIKANKDPFIFDKIDNH
tara:strand:- start:238 stop:711 length:474 start_codon:yes stop_codon:yes gene_type:complete